MEKRKDSKISQTKKQLGKKSNLYPNPPQGWKENTTLSPMVRLIKIMSPRESIHVHPKIRLWTLDGGCTRPKPPLISSKQL
jgi:hypothetical protein